MAFLSNFYCTSITLMSGYFWQVLYAIHNVRTLPPLHSITNSGFPWAVVDMTKEMGTVQSCISRTHHGDSWSHTAVPARHYYVSIYTSEQLFVCLPWIPTVEAQSQPNLAHVHTTHAVEGWSKKIWQQLHYQGADPLLEMALFSNSSCFANWAELSGVKYW